VCPFHVAATGCCTTGLQLGPYSGKLLADLIGSRPTNEAMAALAVTRFSTRCVGFLAER
jgi:glycine/D-amino acid oxidase-like deaminating enzyme